MMMITVPWVVVIDNLNESKFCHSFSFYCLAGASVTSLGSKATATAFLRPTLGRYAMLKRFQHA